MSNFWVPNANSDHRINQISVNHVDTWIVIKGAKSLKTLIAENLESQDTKFEDYLNDVDPNNATKLQTDKAKQDKDRYIDDLLNNKILYESKYKVVIDGKKLTDKKEES